VPIDRNIQKNESFDAVIEIHVLEDGRKPVFHVLSDAELLFVDGLDLHEFVLVVEAQQKGIVDEVEIGTFGQVGLERLNWVEACAQKTGVKLTDGQPVPALVALIQQSQKVAGPIIVSAQKLSLHLFLLAHPFAKSIDNGDQSMHD